ncbi:unnamed protein product [Medioppia subpectinata]|uniref:Uncharacterized protein n=1 Tax=Medioppia subpectinata TaxID=1979941 RepID=A0A7R9L3Z2_9ACAR|nr:unnamed protein product [Medioppia subpectinata]CAG2113943.1 unnamed protein product [Medioppia subpectinata]
MNIVDSIITYEIPEPSDALTVNEYDMLTDIKHNTDTALSHARDQLLYLNNTLSQLKASGVKVLVLRIAYWELSLNIIDELMQQLLIERDVIDEYRVSNNNTRPEVQHVLNKLTRIIMSLHSYVREQNDRFVRMRFYQSKICYPGQEFGFVRGLGDGYGRHVVRGSDLNKDSDDDD